MKNLTTAAFYDKLHAIVEKQVRGMTFTLLTCISSAICYRVLQNILLSFRTLSCFDGKHDLTDASAEELHDI